MSILDEIAVHVHNGRLAQFETGDLRATTTKRAVYLASDIASEMLNRRNEASFRIFSVRLESFVLGRTIAVALKHDHKNAEWARLDPPGSEVWEVRARHVNPELRVLGRFAAFDTFVALNLYDAQIKGKKNWDAAKVRCQADWNLLFPYLSPRFGSLVDDYISPEFTVI
jgi:hypothetical protein